MYVLPAPASSVSIQDLSALGVGLEAGQTYPWVVRAWVGNGFTADDVADGTGIGGYREQITTDSFVEYMTYSKFTTGP
ncbi:hypothetical protein AKJ08_1224 [Vulgatibacter incomptus]|uniref:Uncharacterized protein n=1 Tax=Vulgatibacter incomptus TaxID=1391653 RepID=A0A0K1PBG5_9BACT|nr:hypothetical protein AKJ08_1224 [Vulgatibacter incomptus]